MRASTTTSSAATRLSSSKSAGGFTLLEMLLSMVVVAILLVGVGSAIVLAGKAIPDADSPAVRVYAAHTAADQFMADLHQAVYMLERTATSVAFTVPDRNGDGLPETIRYRWSGVAGDPLIRRYNGVDQTVLKAVQSLTLSYDATTATERYPGPPVLSSEVLFSRYAESDGLIGTVLKIVLGLLIRPDEVRVDGNNWIGQSFAPSLPARCISWKVTRVAVCAEQDNSGGTGTSLWQIRAVDSLGKPTSTVFTSLPVSESQLPSSYGWPQMTLPEKWLEPGQPVAFVVAHPGSGSSAGYFQYDSGGGSGLLRTSDAGATWTRYTTRGMGHYIYGRYTTPGPPQTITRTYVHRVSLRFQVGADGAVNIATAASLANSPEALSAAWEADFSANPTLIDLNANGLGDWVTSDGSAFNAASLSGGVWTADKTLITQSTDNFKDPTAIGLRYRNSSVGGDGAVFTINVDFISGLYMPLIARLQRQADGTQTLTVLHHANDTTPVVGVTVPGLDGGFVDLMLRVDPLQNTVNVRVNRIDYGTFRYTPYPPTGSNGAKKYASIYASGSTAEFDSLRIRVGGTSP